MTSLSQHRRSLGAASIIKQGYLKKLPNAAKPGAKFKSPSRRWFVFGINSNRESYLEYYDSEDNMFTSPPINTISLATCRHVTRDIIIRQHAFAFSLTLSDRVLSLVAQNRDVMLDWCNAFEIHLNLKVRGSEENNYYEPVAFNRSQSEVKAASHDQTVARPRPRTDRSSSQPGLLSMPSGQQGSEPVQNGASVYNLLNFNDENTENERRLFTGVGGLYEPLRMCTEGQAQGQSEVANQDEDFMDLGVPSTLPIRSSRGYDRSMSTPGGAGVAQSQGQSAGSPRSPDASASDANPALPPKIGRQDSRQVKIRGFSTREPEPQTDTVPALPAPPSAARRFARSASQQGPTSPVMPTTPNIATPQRPPTVAERRAAFSRAASTLAYTAASPTTPVTPNGCATSPSGPASEPTTPAGAVSVPGARRTLPPFNEAAGAAAVVSDEPFPNDSGYDLSDLPQKMREAMGLGEGDSAGVYGWNVPPEDETGAPPPYIPKAAFNRGQKSLKQSQVEVLEKEMSHTGGVKVMLRRTDCHHTIALVDYQGKVWIAGWNQKVRPFLHSAFHVGDRLVCVNGQVIENTRMAQKLIKHCSEEDKITFIIRRVPHGKIFAVRRTENGESLGIRREGGTGEVIDVEPYGLSARHGLTAKAQTKEGTNLCNWFLTEINSRPVNLYYKGDEIERRLNAVGKDISFLVQPIEFVDALKKELKANYKNYKDFIVQ